MFLTKRLKLDKIIKNKNLNKKSNSLFLHIYFHQKIIKVRTFNRQE
jgi:hypothetical protein